MSKEKTKKKAKPQIVVTVTSCGFGSRIPFPGVGVGREKRDEISESLAKKSNVSFGIDASMLEGAEGMPVLAIQSLRQMNPRGRGAPGEGVFERVEVPFQNFAWVRMSLKPAKPAAAE